MTAPGSAVPGVIRKQVAQPEWMTHQVIECVTLLGSVNIRIGGTADHQSCDSGKSRLKHNGIVW